MEEKIIREEFLKIIEKVYVVIIHVDVKIHFPQELIELQVVNPGNPGGFNEFSFLLGLIPVMKS